MYTAVYSVHCTCIGLRLIALLMYIGIQVRCDVLFIIIKRRFHPLLSDYDDDQLLFFYYAFYETETEYSILMRNDGTAARMRVQCSACVSS